MSLRLAVETVQGRRPYNEDSVLSATLADGRTLLAVADGMGGHAAGEVASGLALEVLREAIKDGHDLAEGCREANRRVYAAAQSDTGKLGMGTTLVTMLTDHDHFVIANVGDSRAYLVSADAIRQLTEDHSFVAEAIKRGQDEAEARVSPWKNALTRCIGVEAHVDVDLFGPFAFERGLAVVLCSDGLFKSLRDADLKRVFAASEDTAGAARSLVAAALEAGSDDNITVAIAELGEVPRTPLRAEPAAHMDEAGVKNGPGELATAAIPPAAARARTSLGRIALIVTLAAAFAALAWVLH